MERVGEQSGNGKEKRAAGRKDASKQPAVMDVTKFKDDLPKLKKLIVAAEEANEDMNNAITKVAEKSGILASVVRKVAKAWAGDDLEEKRREAEQLHLAFEEAAKV